MKLLAFLSPFLLFPVGIFAQDIEAKLVNYNWRFYDINFPADTITFYKYQEENYKRENYGVADYEAPDQAHGYTFKKDRSIEYWKRYMSHDPDHIIIEKSNWTLNKNTLKISIEAKRFIGLEPVLLDLEYKIVELDESKLVLTKMP